jgi:hypothetical protein
LVVPSTADAAVGDWLKSREPITAWLAQAADAALAEIHPTHLGSDLTAGGILQILIDEQTHHAAEIALLRDLYRWQVTTETT